MVSFPFTQVFHNCLLRCLFGDGGAGRRDLRRTVQEGEEEDEGGQRIFGR